jgi:hypothetical protein
MKLIIARSANSLNKTNLPALKDYVRRKIDPCQNLAHLKDRIVYGNCRGNSEDLPVSRQPE